MSIPIWSAKYIGLPFRLHGRDRAGLDCWGLVRLVYQEQFGRVLPSFSTEYKSLSDVERIHKVIEREAARRTERGIGEDILGDLVVFNYHGRAFHVGIVLGDDCMLHIENNTESAIERYTGARWGEMIYGVFKQ